VTIAVSYIISNDLFLQIVPGQQVERFSTMTNLYTRITLWGMGISLLNDVWLFGIGVGNTVKLLFTYSPHPIMSDYYQVGFDFSIMQSVHQLFLDWFINQGIMAMVGLAGLYYYIIKHFRYVEKYFNNDLVKRFSRSILLALFGLTLLWLQSSGNEYYYFFIFLGSSFAIRKLTLIYHMEEVSKTELVSVKSLL